jgi:hypothetical protein
MMDLDRVFDPDYSKTDDKRDWRIRRLVQEAKKAKQVNMYPGAFRPADILVVTLKYQDITNISSTGTGIKLQTTKYHVNNLFSFFATGGTPAQENIYIMKQLGTIYTRALVLATCFKVTFTSAYTLNETTKCPVRGFIIFVPFKQDEAGGGGGPYMNPAQWDKLNHALVGSNKMWSKCGLIGDATGPNSVLKICKEVYLPDLVGSESIYMNASLSGGVVDFSQAMPSVSNGPTNKLTAYVGTLTPSDAVQTWLHGCK